MNMTAIFAVMNATQTVVKIWPEKNYTGLKKIQALLSLLFKECSLLQKSLSYSYVALST